MGIDFRECLYALSDIIINRPTPLRLVDQIYMKLPDMLLQAELIGRWFKNKNVIFIGDGDAIGLTTTYLGSKKLLEYVPKHITILDFDERIVNSVKQFASANDIQGLIRSELYNVAYSIPKKYWQKFDSFYTNPPWGASNDGNSVISFVQRGIEAVKPNSHGCIVIGDHPDFQWTQDILKSTQEYVMKLGFGIAEMIPQFHRYHLDDNPELRSCSIIIKRKGNYSSRYKSVPLKKNILENFYGKNSPLNYKYIRDITNGGKLASRDVVAEKLTEKDIMERK